MSGKKKAQKKKGKTKETGLDDFDDIVENANDDGCGLSRKNATDIIRLIKCHSKPLNKVATEFIEIFKERCSLVIGMALLAIYDDLAPTDDAASRIVTVYLIYRVRDIEVALRRRNPGGIEDILGHPFMSFFLNLLGYAESEVLTSKAADSASFSPIPTTEKTSVHSESAVMSMASTNVEELSLEQMAEFTRRLLEGKSLTYITPSTSQLYCFDLLNLLSSKCPLERTLIATSRGARGGSPPFPRAADEIWEIIWQSETKQMLKSLEDSQINQKYINLFSRMTDSELSRLIDFNVKIAIEIIDLCVSADEAIALRIMRIVQGMDVTVQCMEVVTRLYQDRPQLPREPLNDYVRYCVRHCLDATLSSNLNRVVRLVAITLKNLLKSGSISATELSLELREFGVRFCQHPDTTFLFNTVGLAQLKERP
ncbi:hypothetical protein KIN20_036356 [Parelaphostrongylus tenuis]|uniref:CCR4-NOT transcription complex subunit 11 n=1 Tax=Parelaphostrongylus tenuis TaxID=148309 RepID=A0AAD5RFZ3_PARTN|nr:hypothetical protein KIN20_036356 [Parelaphostrongylus tenuis]